MKHEKQNLPLDPDVDELLERLRKETKIPKRHIGNEYIRTEARRRGQLKPEETNGQR